MNALTLRSGAPQRPGSRYAAKASERPPPSSAAHQYAFCRNRRRIGYSEQIQSKTHKYCHPQRYEHLSIQDVPAICQIGYRQELQRQCQLHKTKNHLHRIQPSARLRQAFQPRWKYCKHCKRHGQCNCKSEHPTAGPTTLPCVTASTSSVPIIGPVHENETSTKVNAIRNKLIRPVVFPALLLTAFVSRSALLFQKRRKMKLQISQAK